MYYKASDGNINSVSRCNRVTREQVFAKSIGCGRIWWEKCEDLGFQLQLLWYSSLMMWKGNISFTLSKRYQPPPMKLSTFTTSPSLSRYSSSRAYRSPL